MPSNKRILHYKTLGFTLIELVIVIVLLGLLAAIALPRFLDLSIDAKRAAHLQVVTALNAALEQYKLQAQMPLNSQSPIQPTSTFFSSRYDGLLRAIEIGEKTSSDPGNLLLYASKTKLVGAALFVERDAASGRLKSEDDSAPTSAGSNGLGGYKNATESTLDAHSSTCVPIFNLLLSSVSTRTTLATCTNVLGGAILGGANPNSPFLYQTLCPGASPGTVLTLSPSNFTRSTSKFSPSSPASGIHHGSCLWVRTDSINAPPVFYIFYDVSKEIFVSIESDA